MVTKGLMTDEHKKTRCKNGPDFAAISLKSMAMDPIPTLSLRNKYAVLRDSDESIDDKGKGGDTVEEDTDEQDKEDEEDSKNEEDRSNKVRSGCSLWMKF